MINQFINRENSIYYFVSMNPKCMQKLVPTFSTFEKTLHGISDPWDFSLKAELMTKNNRHSR